MSFCEEYAASISEYLDGELPENECAALASHLESCPGCASLLEAYSSMSEALALETELPENFHSGTMYAVSLEKKRGSFLGRFAFGRWTAATAAAAMLILAIWGIYGRVYPSPGLSGPMSDYHLDSALPNSGSGVIAGADAPYSDNFAGSAEDAGESIPYATSRAPDPAPDPVPEQKNSSSLKSMPLPEAASPDAARQDAAKDTQPSGDSAPPPAVMFSMGQSQGSDAEDATSAEAGSLSFPSYIEGTFSSIASVKAPAAPESLSGYPSQADVEGGVEYIFVPSSDFQQALDALAEAGLAFHIYSEDERIEAGAASSLVIIVKS